MSSSQPTSTPPTDDESLVRWMQIGSSIYWHDDVSPESILPVRQTLAPTCARPPAVQNSYLLNLPTECLQQIILLLDIESLFKFRQTSVGIQQKVDSLFEFRKATKHALDLLGATFTYMVAKHISLSEFYYQLCNKHCILCDNIANYINLQTWTRVCDSCVHEKGLSASREDLSGEFNKMGGAYEFILWIFNFKAQRHPMDRRRLTSCLHNMALFDRDLIKVPHLDIETDRFEYGMGCIPCLRKLGQPRRVYDRKEFLEHFSECEEAQRDWERYWS